MEVKEKQNKFEEEINIQNKIERDIAVFVYSEEGTIGIKNLGKLQETIKKEIVRRNYLPEEWMVPHAVDRVYEIFLSICREESIKVEKLYPKAVRKIKRKRILIYLGYMLLLSILLVLSIGISFPDNLQWAILCGFIYGLFYPIYAWIRKIVSWNK